MIADRLEHAARRCHQPTVKHLQPQITMKMGHFSRMKHNGSIAIVVARIERVQLTLILFPGPYTDT